jgi:hypothetical protein
MRHLRQHIPYSGCNLDLAIDFLITLELFFGTKTLLVCVQSTRVCACGPSQTSFGPVLWCEVVDESFNLVRGLMTRCFLTFFRIYSVRPTFFFDKAEIPNPGNLPGPPISKLNSSLHYDSTTQRFFKTEYLGIVSSPTRALEFISWTTHL